MHMIEEFNKYLMELVDDKVFPGCSYAIIVENKVMTGYIGYETYDKEKKIDENSLYDIASLTKLLVTNTLISFLIEEEKIKLDDLVNKYLPKFKYDNIKIVHLLTHSSGLKVKYTKDTLKSINDFYNLDLEFEAGTTTAYRDINFILLGFIVEKVYKNKIDKVAKELIFDKLNMHNTMYNPKEKDRCVPTENNTRLIKGEVQDWKASFLKGIAGHAGIFSNVSDIAKFLEVILNDGIYNKNYFISSNLIDLWFTPLFIDNNDIRRTIGWIYAKSTPVCKDLVSNDAIFHTGYPGNHIIIDRGNDLSFVLLSNATYPTGSKESIVNKRIEINKNLYQLLKKYDYIY